MSIVETPSPPLTMATNEQSQIPQLDISDILKKDPNEHELINLLADIDSEWYEVGLAFKVSLNTLIGLSQSQERNIVKLSKVIYNWKTTTESNLVTWETVIASLEEGRIINNKRVASKIREYLTKAKEEALQRYFTTLSQCPIDSVKVSQLLFSERCISEETLDKIEMLESSPDEKKTTLLSAIRTPVSSDHKKLKVLATVLSKFEETKHLSKTIFNDYAQHNQPQEIAKKSFNFTSHEDHASDILRCHYGTLSQSLQYPIRVTRLLHEEGVISESILDCMETCKQPVTLLLNTVRKVVHNNYKNLKVFANVLQKYVDNIQLGDTIMKDYEQSFDMLRDNTQAPPTNEDIVIPSNDNRQAEIFVPRNMRPTFHSMRIKFGTTFNKVREAIKKTPLTIEKLKYYLLDCYPELTPQLSHPNINTIDNMLDIVKEKCTLIDIYILEAIAERFDIKEVETYIKDYKDAIDEFCRTVSIGLCLQESLEVTKSSSLNCETAKFVLEWNPDKTSLSDVKELLSAAFEQLKKKVKVIVVRDGNSIIVTCTFPISLLGPIIAKAQETLKLVKKKGLIKLTIGYDIIYDKHQRDKEITATKGLTTPQQDCPVIDDGAMTIESTEETRQESRYLPPVNYELLIISSYGEVSNSIIVARKCIPNDQKGSNEWMKNEIEQIREKHKKSQFCTDVLIYSEFPGNDEQHSKDYYLEEIKKFLNKCECGKAIIFYTGHGETNTGNWCFKDGIVTFQDIFKLYEDNFKGKLLTINSDCSYSGNWIKDCAKTLDDLSISSCGHHTRKAGILLNVWCSCDVEEEATALCYVNEAIRFDEDKKSVMTDFNTQLTSGQNTKLGDFRQIRCSETMSDPCGVKLDTKTTWEDRVFPKSHLVHLIRSIKWQYVQVYEDKVDEFKHQVKKGIVNVADYGRVLFTGWGQDPPPEIIHQVGLKLD